MLRRQPLDIGQLQLIIALHHHLGAQLAEVLVKVIGKGVVVIDQQQHVRSGKEKRRHSLLI